MMGRRRKFRKRPVVVEAVQYTEHDAREIMIGLVDTFFGHPAQRVTTEEGAVVRTGKIMVRTLEGPLLASPGDWIVRGIQGEEYPVKPEVFEKTYEPVDEETP